MTTHNQHLGHGTELLNLGQFTEALAAFDAALALGDQPEAHAGRGLALDRLRRHNEAVEAFDLALAARPGELDWLLGRGLAQYENSDNIAMRRCASS